MAATTSQLHPAIQRYLTALETKLRQTPGVAPEEGLADAHEFLQSEWESLSRRGAAPCDDDLFQHFVVKFGAPEDVAADYASALETTADVAWQQSGDAPQRLARKRVKRALLGALALLGIGLLTAALGRHLVARQKMASGADAGPQWASRVVSFTRGGGESQSSSDPAAALGAPDCHDNYRDDYSYVSLGLGGGLVLEFERPLCEGSGPDLKIVEIGPLAEAVDVAVSSDGQQWTEVGRAKGAEATIDLAPFVRPEGRFRFVRLIDVQSVRNSKNNWPGADIDAVGALHTAAKKWTAAR